MTTTRARSAPRTLLAIAASLGLLVALAIPASATHVDPEPVAGNPTCGELGDYEYEYKIEPVTGGTHDDPNSDFSVDLTINGTEDGQTFDFEANLAVEAVFVKGGSSGNLYEYSPAAFSDTGLHAQLNIDGSGDWYGLSHLSFCWTTAPGETPTPTPTPSESQSSVEETPTPTPTPTPSPTPTPVPSESQAEEEDTPTPSPTPAPREDVQGGNPTPTPSAGIIPDTAMGGMTQVPATVLSLVMLAALAATAYARLARQR